MKKILCLVSSLVIGFSFSVPASSANEEYTTKTVLSLSCEDVYSKLSSTGLEYLGGYQPGSMNYIVCSSGERYIDVAIWFRPDNEKEYILEGFCDRFIQFKNEKGEWVTLSGPEQHYRGRITSSIGIYIDRNRGFAYLNVDEVVYPPDPVDPSEPEPPFGQGGLAGDSTDFHYGVEVITDVFNKLWNVLTDYWWVMVGLCLPIAFYLLCILADLFKKTPKARFKPKLYSTGYYSGKRAYSPNSPTFDINYNTLERRRRRKGKGGGLDMSKYEVFEIDGITYYRDKKKKKSDRETSSFYKDDLFTYKDGQWYSGGKAVSGGSGKPVQRKKPVNVDIEVDE